MINSKIKKNILNKQHNSSNMSIESIISSESFILRWDCPHLTNNVIYDLL